MAGPATFDRACAVVAAAGAVVVGGWFVLIGLDTDVDGPVRALPFALAVLAVAVFGGLAVRSWRRAGRHPSEGSALDDDDEHGDDDGEDR